MKKLFYLIPSIAITTMVTARDFNKGLDKKTLLRRLPVAFLISLLWYPAVVVYFSYVALHEMGFINDPLGLYNYKKEEKNND